MDIGADNLFTLAFVMMWQPFIIPLYRYSVIPSSLKRLLLGIMGAEITKIISEQNKISSTLNKNSSEQKFLARSYLLLFRGHSFELPNNASIPMNKGRIAVDYFPVSKANLEIN